MVFILILSRTSLTYTVYIIPQLGLYYYYYFFENIANTIYIIPHDGLLNYSFKNIPDLHDL